MQPRIRRVAIAAISLVAATVLPLSGATALAPIQVILDGRPLVLDPAPTIVNNRTLVPLRGVFEAMGAAVSWEGTTRTVEVTKGERFVRLKIDRRLGCLDRSCFSAATLDVPAQIMDSRTFVPVRFISQAIGANVAWDGQRRAVIIDTTAEPVPQPAPIQIEGLLHGQVITDPVALRARGSTGSLVKFHLVDPATGSGPLVAAGADPAGAYTFTPDPMYAGLRHVVASVRGLDGVTRYSDPVLVLVMPNPAVAVTGADQDSTVDGPIRLGSKVGFVATHVVFELADAATGSKESLATTGPNETFTWFPQIAHNGNKRLEATAYDRAGRAYPSEPVRLAVRSGYRQALGGIKEGDVLNRPVTFSVATSYPVESVQYVLNGRVLGWGLSYHWQFGPESNGRHSLQVNVVAKDGTRQTLGPVDFSVDTAPQVWPSGIGPNQVVTGPVTLKSTSNIPLSTVEWQVIDPATGVFEALGRVGAGESFTWTPLSRHAGNRTLRAIGIGAQGESVVSAPVNFRVYLGKVHGPQPIVPRSEFLALASRLSVPAYHDTGMSAALKVAQAILETGWGQSSPVDKYTGQISYNLFGIKGKGPAGSVISNTWEEYNGVAYRVDDNFRAYHNIEESWKDHADLLLTRSWYAPYREVMTNPVLGAWALRRSGYATDSQYPVKLINIMKQNDLFKLDECDL